MILVTGGAGYIGSHAVRMLIARGEKVLVFDNLSEGHEEAASGAELVIGDLRDRGAVTALFKSHPIEIVFHFANLCRVADSMAEPELYFDVNVTGGMNLLDAMRRSGVRKMIFSSSAAVYGSPEQQPIPEDAPREPINPYGLTKVMFEDALSFACRHWGMGAVSLRYFNAAGAADDGSIGESHARESHIIPIALEAALGRRDAVRIFGTDYPTKDGSCLREFVHVEDIAEAHLLAMKALAGKVEHGIYNIGAGVVASVKEVIETARRVTGGKIKAENAPRRTGDPVMLQADSAKIRRELGWRPRYAALESIIETAWRWAKAPKY